MENTLLIDLEKGSSFVEALKFNVTSLQELHALGEAIKEKGKPYSRIAIDTVTKLEEWCEEAGTNLYKRTPIGRNFTGKSVLELPNGAGYFWLRTAFEYWRDYLLTLADEVILIGHLKDKLIEVQGKEVAAKDIDLTGKIRSITCAAADAIGYLYRKDGKIFVTFKSSDEITCGSRCEHLKGQEFEFDWKKIYLN